MSSGKVPVGTPFVPGLAGEGDDVVYVADLPLYGAMEFRGLAKNGMALCRLDSGEFELFEVHEISTVEAVAKSAARALGEDDAASVA